METITNQAIAALASVESEQSVLGALMISNDAIDLCATLRSDMFFDRANGIIFSAIRSLIAEGKPADVVTVTERLEAMGRADEFGGIAHLADLYQNTPSAANLRRYVEIVQTRHAERQMRLAGDLIAELATERDGRTLAERQAEAMRLLESIGDNAGDGAREQTAAEAMLACIKDIDDRMSRPEGELGGLPSGLAALDDMLDGLRPGELIVIGGRPSMGKSCLGEIIARTNAKRGQAVRVQSYEMPGKDLMARSAAADRGINLQHIRKARMTHDEYLDFELFVGSMGRWNLVIDDDAAGVDKIAARSRTQRRRTGLDLLIIDHLHLIPKLGKNEVQEIGEITGTLKRLATELSVPVVLLAQLNRAAANGVVRAPTLTDLRGSGAIEQDADVVIFPHRPGYYSDDANPGEAELHIAKHRNGPVGVVGVGWRGDFVRFQDQIPTDWNPPKRTVAKRDEEEL